MSFTPWTARLVVALLLATGWGLPLAFPHVADDDVLCVPVQRGDEPAAPQLDAAVQVAAADHCAVCHLQRSIRNARLDGSTVSAPLALARLLPAAAPSAHRAPSALQLPPRAPPIPFA